MREGGGNSLRLKEGPVLWRLWAQRVSQEIEERIAVMQRGVGGITKGQAVMYTLSDGKKIQKVTEVVTGTGSVVRAVSFLHR